jgi:peptidoglycan/LPS O-acetylase OafA/YrhL
MKWSYRVDDQVLSPSLSSRVYGLDELRGLSIIWVFICHGTGLTTWLPSAFSGYGFHGVVLFYLISGYLITRILLETRERENFFSRFYINRVFRIWPLMLLALLVSIAIWPEFARSVVLNLLLVNNYGMAVGIEPPARTDVMWSLAIEEQFYLFWPVLIWLFSRKQVHFWIFAIILLGLAFDSHLLPGGDMIIHKTTHGNMQYIAMGAAVALGGAGLRVMLAAWAVFFLWWLGQHGLGAVTNFRWVWYGVTFLLGLLVFYTVLGKPIIRNHLLASVGRLCYGLYIIHFFVSALAFELFRQSVWQGPLLYVVLSMVLSIVSYKYFEMPIQNARVHFYENRRRKVMLFAGFALMTMVSVVYLVTTTKF